VIAVGEEGRLRVLLDFLKVGPLNAVVASVDVSWIENADAFNKASGYDN